MSSPTGSGKTVIFELAIIRFLEMFGKLSNDLENSKIIYGKTYQLSLFILIIYKLI